MDQVVINLVGTAILAVIGWFLKSTIEELRSGKDLAVKANNDISVIKVDYMNKYDHLTEKFDELATSVKDLTKEIKELNKELQKKL